MQSTTIENIKLINNSSCNNTPHVLFNSTKGLIYTNDFHSQETSRFKTEIRKKYGVTDVTEAKWIKSINPHSRAFILDFQQDYTTRQHHN